jgi:hypothetical protein
LQGERRAIVNNNVGREDQVSYDQEILAIGADLQNNLRRLKQQLDTLPLN